MKMYKSILVSLVAAACLAACGGGGSDAGTSPFGQGSGVNTDSSSTTNVSSNTAGSVVLSLSSSQISASQPGTVTAVVKNAAGQPISGVLVQFGIAGSSGSIAQVSPASAITDASGQAATTLTPSSGATSGAAYVTASADTSAGTLTARATFSVSATNVTLGAVTLEPNNIDGYGSSAVNFAVTGASSASPVTVNVSSTCATSGKATISPTSVTVTSGSGSVTYQDKACSTTDRINVQIAGTTQQRSVDLLVRAPATQGIQYTSVDTANICLVGTGCPSVANVVFKVVDAGGNGKAGVKVNFSLDPSVADFAALGSTNGTTKSDGTVSVAVSSKTTPTPLRVTAVVDQSNPEIKTVSNVLTISGGLPVAGNTSSHTGISFSSAKYALNANLDGDESALTLRLTDRFGSPAVDGTAVTLVSDGGTVVPSYCTTVNGACSVRLLVSNPKPANGRVHVLAYAKGQEYFVDADNNGAQNGTEAFDDVPMGVCLDKDEDDVCDAGEFIVGVAATPDASNRRWDSAGTAFARLSRTIFFSVTSLQPRLFKVANNLCTDNEVDAAYMTVTMGTAPRQLLQFCIRDANEGADDTGGSPIASGSTLAVKATIGTVGVTVDNSPVPAALEGPSMHVVTISNAAAPTAIPAGGTVDLTVTMGGKAYTLLNAVRVNP